MTRTTTRHMMSRPYIQSVIQELQRIGYPDDSAKEVLVKHYKGVKRTWGFDPNPKDFAKIIDEINRAVIRKYDPTNPDHIYIGDVRDRLKTKH